MPPFVESVRFIDPCKTIRDMIDSATGLDRPIHEPYYTSQWCTNILVIDLHIECFRFPKTRCHHFEWNPWMEERVSANDYLAFWTSGSESDESRRWLEAHHGEELQTSYFPYEHPTRLKTGIGSERPETAVQNFRSTVSLERNIRKGVVTAAGISSAPWLGQASKAQHVRKCTTVSADWFVRTSSSPLRLEYANTVGLQWHEIPRIAGCTFHGQTS